MNGPDHTSPLRQFRAEIYSSFQHRQDSCMDLLDALCASLRANVKVVSLALITPTEAQPLFEHLHNDRALLGLLPLRLGLRYRLRYGLPYLN